MLDSKNVKYMATVLWVVLSSFSEAMANDRGRAQFSLCMSCHGDKGQGNANLQAPAIANLPEWYITAQLKKFKSGARGTHPKDMPGLRMSPMAKTLSDKDLELVSAYVSELPSQTLKHTIRGNPTKGEKLYAVCAACHGNNAAGNKALNAPPLIGLNDWYLKTQLINFQKGLRGADAQRDPVGYSMSSMAKTLGDDTAIDNVIDYILALQGIKGEEVNE